MTDLFPWELALRRIAKLPSPLEPPLQKAAQAAWIETKLGSLGVKNYILCAGLRKMLPAYSGPAVQLYRSAGLVEQQRRAYGVSWTDDFTQAERYAENEQFG